MKILIVGGSGGIGLAIVKKSLEKYPDAEITATYSTHSPLFSHPRLRWEKLDVRNEDEIKSISEDFKSIDILINAVGFLYSSNHKPEKSIYEFDVDFYNLNIALNTVPSILLAKYFMKSLRSKNNTYYIVLSAKIGSIMDNKIGGWISYRSSKSALNMAIKTISIEWTRKVPNCCVMLFHPGTTDTKLSKPFQQNLPIGQLHTSEFTATALLKAIEESTHSDSGKFKSFDGSEISW